VPVLPDELSPEFIIFCHEEVNVPFQKDVLGVNVLRISLPSDLGNKIGGVIWFTRLGGRGFPLSGGHLHKKWSQESS